jgi:hypothetical protein
MLTVTATLILTGAVSLMVLLMGIIGYAKLNKIHLKFPNYELLDAKKRLHYSNLNDRLKKKMKVFKKFGTNKTFEQDDEDKQHLVDQSIVSSEKDKSMTKTNLSESLNLYDRMLSDFVSADESNKQSEQSKLRKDERFSQINKKEDLRFSSFV